MSSKKSKVDRFKNGSMVIECTQTETRTEVRDSKGTILFHLGESLDGAWSHRRVARAMHRAYLQGVKKSGK